VPVAGVSSQDILARAGFFEAAIEVALASPAFVGVPLFHHPRIPVVLAESYFALTEAYKYHHLQPGKRTEEIKQAALTAATICVVKPLRPQHGAAATEEMIYCNQMLAMRAACAIVEHPFGSRAFDERRRFYRAIGDFALPAIAPLIAEANANNGELTTEFSFDLSLRERHDLNMLINMFAVLRDLRIYKTAASVPTEVPSSA
jgi:hypothetical protein